MKILILLISLFISGYALAEYTHEDYIRLGCENNQKIYNKNPKYLCLEYASILSEREGKDTRKSLKFLKKGMTYRCDNFSSCTTNGWIYYKFKKLHTAEEFFRRAINLGTENDEYELAMAHNNLGLTLESLEKGKDAIEQYSIACNLKLFGARYGCWNLAIHYSKIKNQKKTLKYLKMALEKGYNHWKWIEVNERSGALRKTPGALEMVSKYKK